MGFNSLRKMFAAVTAMGLISAVSAVGAPGASSGSSLTRARSATTKAHGVSAPIRYSVDIQAIYDAAGNPNLVANFSPDGGLAKPRWSICSPPDVNACTPTNRRIELQPGPTPAGTVFQASATYKGKTYVARSGTWLGTVRATVRPRLDGRPRYHASVTPHGASWIGGWQADPHFRAHSGFESGGRGPNFDLLSVEACRTRSARKCVGLSAPRGYGFGKRPPIVGASFTGWYLFAFDQRFAHDTVFADSGSPAAPPVKTGATVARSAPLGPVIGPPAPSVSILHDAILRGGRVLVARIRCSVRRRVWLQVDDNQTGGVTSTTLTGSELVSIPRQQLRRGQLNVQICVDDGPPVLGKSQFR